MMNIFDLTFALQIKCNVCETSVSYIDKHTFTRKHTKNTNENQKSTVYYLCDIFKVLINSTNNTHD